MITALKYECEGVVIRLQYACVAFEGTRPTKWKYKVWANNNLQKECFDYNEAVDVFNECVQESLIDFREHRDKVENGLRMF